MGAEGGDSREDLKSRSGDSLKGFLSTTLTEEAYPLSGTSPLLSVLRSRTLRGLSIPSEVAAGEEWPSEEMDVGSCDGVLQS